MKKRFLAALLALCMVFALGTVSALADDLVSTEDNVYTTLPAADSDGVIKLDKDVVLQTSAVIEGSIVLDLNGHSITASDNWPSQDNTYDYLIGVKRGATLTVKDSGSDGIIDATNSNANKLAVAIKLTLKDEGETGSVASLIVESGIIKGTSYGISGNGTRHNTSLSISGGQVVATNGVGIYNPQEGTVTIRGGSITGVASAIELRSGTLNISGGTFTATATEYKEEQNSNGTTVTGAAIAISQHTTKRNISVTISGGTFNGVYALRETDVQNSGTTSNIDIVSISDGTFNGKVSSDDCNGFITGGSFEGTTDEGFEDYLAPGFAINDDGEVVVGPDAVARVGDTVYTDLQVAINAAQNGTTKTVTLLKDVSVSAADLGNTNGAITIKGNITLDGNGKEITITGVTGEAGTRPSAINIQNGADVTLKNLDVDSNGAKHGLNINDAGAVKLEDVEIMNSAWYAVVCNNSRLTVDGLYTHDNQWGVNVDKGSTAKFNDATISEEYSVVVGEDDGTQSTVELNDGSYNVIQVKTGNVDLDIAGGTYEDIEVIDSVTITNQISITGGTFGASVKDYVDDDFKYELETADGEFSYYKTMSAALAAAGDEDEITYIGSTTETVSHEVTFVYSDYKTVTVTVPDETEITLPSASRTGVKFLGWSDGWDIYDAGDEYTVDDDVTFTAVWEAAAYDIVIDDDILHGDIWTSPRSEAEAGDTVHVYADPDAGYVLEDLSVTYRSGRNELKLTRVSANHYTFTMPARDVYVTAEFTSDGFPFDDVRSNQWFYDAVYYVWANDLMEGVDYDEFNPNGTMTRAMFWAVLGRIDGETITGSDWADEARDWAMSEGVSDGTDPNGLVTREQMVTMLWRYAGERDGSGSLSRYTDGDKVAQYATEAMRWALGNGIIEGTTATTLEPQATATRAQCAAIFMRYYK